MLQDVTQKSFDPESLIVGLDEVHIKRLVLRIFDNKCAICEEPAGEVHEMVPRVRGKKSLTFRNRIAICNYHHDEEHHYGASPKRIETLKQCRARYLIKIGKKEYV